MNPNILRLITASGELKEDQSPAKVQEYAKLLDAVDASYLSAPEAQLYALAILAFATLLKEQHGSFTYLIPSVPA